MSNVSAAPMRWVTGEFKIAVVGDICDGIFGIRERWDGMWFVTHTPTGRVIARFRSREHAVECSERISVLPGWEEVTSAFVPPALTEEVIRIRDEIERRIDSRS